MRRCTISALSRIGPKGEARSTNPAAERSRRSGLEVPALSDMCVRGRLVQVSSVAAVRPYDLGPDYSPAKAGVVDFCVPLSS